MESLKGKVVFITGASSGIGRACAEAFAADGAKLVLVARNAGSLDEVKASIAKEHPAVEVFSAPMDVTKKKDVFSLVENLPAAFREIDILVNNAGLGLGLDKLHEADPDDWDRMIDTNVKGLLYATRAILPSMVKRGSGHVINIGSVAGRDIYPGGNVYCATKFAVKGLTRALKVDLLGTGVRVSTIDPGMVETNFSNVRFKGDSARAKKTYEGMTPLLADDIADAVVWAASRPARVNILEMVVMPTDQSGATFVHRRTK